MVSMEKRTRLDSEHQTQINVYFDLQSSFWKDIYSRGDIYAAIHQQRYARVLDWVGQLGLEPGARVVDIGCGAGFLSLALAQQNFQVQALDAVEAMVEQTRRHVTEAGLTERISVNMGSITTLPCADEAFDLTLAIGVIPWIGRGKEPARQAIQEMKRVTRPGGYLLFTVDNRLRFAAWFDPLRNPLILGPKHWLKTLLARVGLRRQSAAKMQSYLHRPRFIEKTLGEYGLVKLQSVTLGFGPFTFFHRPLLTNKAGIALHHRLQRLAERGFPLLRGTGAQYIVLAQKPATSSIQSSPAADDDVTAHTSL